MKLLWYHFKRNGIEIPYADQGHPSQAGHAGERACRTGTAGRRDHQAYGEGGNPYRALSKPELKKLVQQVSIETYAAGEVPVRQGEPGDSFYIIKSGTVDVVVEKSAGEQRSWPRSAPGISSEK